MHVLITGGAGFIGAAMAHRLLDRGDRTFVLSENQSTFIPLGEQHRLKNPGTVDLELIEVQSGAYLGEDDIERIDDEYGRS